MRIEFLHTQGPGLVFPSVMEDDRGAFFRYYCEDTFRAHIPGFMGFLQCNQSINRHKGTLRGLHYQASPHSEAKLVRCIRGAVYDVCIDLRAGSPTFLQVFAQELNEANKIGFYIPEGFAHGFITLTDHTELIYHHSHRYVPEADRGIRYDDPLLQISWPMAPAVISSKDAAYPFLENSFNGIHL